MGKKKSKNKKIVGEKEQRKKITKVEFSLFLSIVAILISIAELYFNHPNYLKRINKVEVKATDLGISKDPESINIESSFVIENTGKNTAKNVKIELRVLENSIVIFSTKTFKLENPDHPKTPVKNLLYTCPSLVAGEKVKVYVLSNFEDYLEINKIDTLVYNTRTALPKFYYGPYISKGKHDDGNIKYYSRPYLYLNK